MNKDRNTLYLDTDLEGEEFQTYVNNKKVGDDVDFHVRGRIKSMDEGSIAVSVETIFKIEGWENPGDDDEDEEVEEEADESDDEEEGERKGKPKFPKAMAIIFSEASKNKKSRSGDSVY